MAADKKAAKKKPREKGKNPKTKNKWENNAKQNMEHRGHTRSRHQEGDRLTDREWKELKGAD